MISTESKFYLILSLCFVGLSVTFIVVFSGFSSGGRRCAKCYQKGNGDALTINAQI